MSRYGSRCRRPGVRVLVGAGCLVLGAGLVRAAVAAQQATTFRSTSNVVAVEAAVVDKAGRPITNLAAADFTILEDGQPQPVQTIYLVSADPNFVRTGVVPSAGTTGTTGAAAGAGPGTAAATAATGVRRELRSRVLLFVFDLNHLGTDAYKRSKAAVESFLKDGALPGDLVGVVAGTTMLNNRIDSNHAAVLQAMATMAGPNQSRYNDMRAWPRLIDEAEAVTIARGDNEALTRAVLRACGERQDECGARGGDDPVRQQIEAKSRQVAADAQRYTGLTLSTLQTLATSLGRFPGAKHVFVFSEGFYTGEQRAWMATVTAQAARNNVHFSTFDARGLSRDVRTQGFMADGPLQTAGDLSAYTLDDNADVLTSLAVDTGGEIIMNRNDLRPGLDIVSRASSVTYVLGYAPAKTMDGSYRKIEVKVSRPDAVVRARRGYIATPEPGMTDSAPKVSSGSTTGAAAEPTVTGAPKFRPNSDRNVTSLTNAVAATQPADVRALAQAGWDAYALGDVALAQQKLSQATASGRAAPWVSYALGFSEYALGHYAAAASAWDSVRTRVPEFMPVYFDLADAYISMGRGPEALGILRDAAKRWPTEPEAQNAFGTQLVRRGALDEAIDVFVGITTATPADALGWFNLGRAYHLRYLRLQQNVAASRLRQPTALGEEDRKRAAAAYTRHIELKGQFEKEAKEALAQLDWKQ